MRKRDMTYRLATESAFSKLLSMSIEFAETRRVRGEEKVEISTERDGWVKYAYSVTETISAWPGAAQCGQLRPSEAKRGEVRERRAMAAQLGSNRAANKNRGPTWTHIFRAFRAGAATDVGQQENQSVRM